MLTIIHESKAIKIMKKPILAVFLTLLSALSVPSLLAQMLDPAQLQQVQTILQQNGVNLPTNNSNQIEKAEDVSRPKQPEFDNDILSNGSVATEIGIQEPERLKFESEPKERLTENNLEVFGYDLFRNAPTTFAPASDIPVTPNYIIGPGDFIEIILFGNENQEYSLQVNRQGEIYIPSIGPIQLSGLSFSETKELINQIIENQKIGVSASITLGELRSIQVYVIGEAYQPGLYMISSLSTLTNALFASGGVNDMGSLRNIQVKRSGQTVVTFDLYDLLLKGDSSRDIRLQPGDVVFIPLAQKRVSVNGSVKRPFIFEAKDEETVDDLIGFAGGFLSQADKSSVELIRDNDRNGKVIINIDYSQTEVINRNVQDGDSINVYDSIKAIDQAILISGYVKRPGFYQWKEGLTLNKVINFQTDLMSNTDRDYIVLKRVNYNTGSINIFQARISELEEADFQLRNKDEIIFFKKVVDNEEINLSRQNDDSVDQNTQIQKLGGVKRFVSNQVESSDSEPAIDSIQTLTPTSTSGSGSGLIAQISTIGAKTDSIILLNEGEQYAVGDDVVFTKDNRAFKFTIADISKDIDFFQRKELLKDTISQIEQNSTLGKKPRIIEVIGDVKFPGKYPLSENMTIEKAIFASGGLRNTAYAPEIEIFNFDRNGKTYKTSSISMSFNNNKTRKMSLSPMTIISVKSVPVIVRKVNIQGAVHFPGEYVVEENESLRSLLKRAGGLLPNANPDGSVFLRNSIKDLEEKRLKEADLTLRRELLIGRNSGLGEVSNTSREIGEQLSNLAEDLKSVKALGRLVINLSGIIDGKDNLSLLDGDKIMIPYIQEQVSVIGEVFAPSNHVIDFNLGYMDYIDRSGGFTQVGDKDNVYIIRADGSIDRPNKSSGFFRGSTQLLEPGDTIVVPLEVTSFSSTQALTEVSQIIYQLAVAAAAVSSF